MIESITLTIFRAVGKIASAVAPKIYKSIAYCKSTSQVRNITGRWVGKEERGNQTRKHVLQIIKQLGREFEGIRILEGGDAMRREYIMKGFFSGDLLSGAIIDSNPKESRTLSFLFKVHTSDKIRGKLLLWTDDGQVQASEEMVFVREQNEPSDAPGRRIRRRR